MSIKIAAAVETFINVRTIAAVAAVLATATASAQDVTKQAAMDWAVQHRAEAFDRLLPAAVPPSIRPDVSISIRSAGFEDRFEFLLKLEKRRNRPPTAVLMMAEGEPLTVQLARARFAGAQTLDEALARVRLMRRTLPPSGAERLFHAITSRTIPLKPQTGFYLHQPHFEITALGWSELHFSFYDDAANGSDFSKLSALIFGTLKGVGVDQTQLHFDPRHFYGS